MVETCTGIPAVLVGAWLVLVPVLCAEPPATPEPEAEYQTRWKTATKLLKERKDRKKNTRAAIRLFEQVAADEAAPDTRRVRAWYEIGRAQERRLRNRKAARTAYGKVIDQGNAEMWFFVRAKLSYAWLLYRDKQLEAALTLYEEAREEATKPGDRANAIRGAAQTCARLGRWQHAGKLYAQLRDLGDADDAPTTVRRMAHDARIKRLELLLAHAPPAEAVAELMATLEDGHLRQQYGLVRTATKKMDHEQLDTLRGLFQDELLRHCNHQERLYQVLVTLHDIARARGHKAEALQAAASCYYLCSNRRLMESVKRVVDALHRVDGDLSRALDFLWLVRCGPAGYDQKAGTEDDLAPILPRLTAPADAKTAALVDDVLKRRIWGRGAGHRHARLYLVLNQPAKALACLRRAFELCPRDKKKLQYTLDQVATLTYRLTHDKTKADAAAAFLAYGAHGKDGKPGTDDDLQDPFAAIEAGLKADEAE